MLEAYESWLARQSLSPRTRGEYARWVRLFCRWLAEESDEGALGADPFADLVARDYAARDFKRFLKSERALVEVIDGGQREVHRGRSGHLCLGRANVRRESLPVSTPRALSRGEQRRLLRAAERAGARDRALVVLMLFAGLRIDETVADLRFALEHRGDSRLGVAVQLCALRWLGFVPDELTGLPQPALLSLCDQLEANPADLDGYGARGQTRTDQFAAARAHAAFRSCEAPESAAQESWLAVRAMEHERPKALFALAAEHLRARRIVRPSVDQLVRLIGGPRARAPSDLRRARWPLTDHATRARLDGAAIAGGVWVPPRPRDAYMTCCHGELRRFRSMASRC